MSEYGYYGNRSKKRKGRAGEGGEKQARVLPSLSDIIMAPVTVAVCAAYVIALLAMVISPRIWAFPAIVSLVSQFIYVALFLVMLFWLIRWKWPFWITALLVITGLGHIGGYYRPDISKPRDESQIDEMANTDAPDNSLVVMTYNVMGFYGDSSSTNVRTVEDIAGMMSENGVSVACFQEFVRNRNSESHLESALPNMRYSYYASYDPAVPDADGNGIAVYSEFPISDSGIIDMGSDRTHSIWVDIQINDRTVRVISNHLQNTHITRRDRAETITSRLISDTTAPDKVRKLSRKLLDNYVLRADQADILHRFVKESPYETVVCGDFNDTPASYTCHRVSRGLSDTFTKKGRGYVHTYCGFRNFLRIDYILVSRRIETLEYWVGDCLFSDHLPVFSRIRLKGRPRPAEAADGQESE